MFCGDIRLLRPLIGQVHLLECHQAEHGQAQWARCEWGPQGHLLLAQWAGNSTAEAEGFAIIDPVTFEEILELDQPAGNICWAEPPFMSGPCLVAFFSGIQRFVEFSSHGEGNWRAIRAVQCTWTEAMQGSKVYISPDGRNLVGLQGHVEPYNICHFAMRFEQERSLELEGPRGSRSGFNITVAPFPCGWPAVYAFVHPIKPAWPRDQARASGPQFALSLVDCKRHAVLGSWTARDLWEHIFGQQLHASGFQFEAQHEVQSAKWSPDRKHLAVICGSCTMVMTFSEA